MQLDQYLKEKDLTNAAFGRLAGLTRQAVQRYRTGERIPEQSEMTKIFEATEGRVTPNDFYGVGLSPQPVKAAS